MHRIKCFSTKSILLNIGEAARRALFAICKNRQDIIGKIKMGKCQRLLDTNVSYVLVTVKILYDFVLFHKKFKIQENPENTLFPGFFPLLQYSLELSL